LAAPAQSLPLPGPRDDILVIGAGLAGLFLALQLAPRPVRLVAAAPLGEGASSAWAQGGLAAAMAPQDSPEAHARDTIAAGAGLVDPSIARLIAHEGPARVRDLLALGVPFDRTPDGQLRLSLEAAHSFPRVARVSGDLAGKAIMDALTRAALSAPHITLITGARAVALIHNGARVSGAILRDASGTDTPCPARHTVLATGGSGGLWPVTTNPASALADALAIGFQAGALIADPEFVQFHPTAIDVGRDPAPLATEALRGEGAILRNADGTAFMARYHESADLAPRDVVARAIHAERESGRGAFLDTRAAIGDDFPHHFPTVFAACMAAGIDPRRAPIPVAPAAHYHMGGLVTDIWGQTTLDGLSACGECASTGAHGANRLASNSLLEAVVFAQRIALRLRTSTLTDPQPGPRDATPAPELPPEALARLRTAMGRHAGVLREEAGLETLLAEIDALTHAHGPAHPLTSARLIASAALARRESRGGHERSDYPATHEPALRTFIGGPFTEPHHAPAHPDGSAQPARLASSPHAQRDAVTFATRD
jgi:L-aspartate oxidase